MSDFNINKLRKEKKGFENQFGTLIKKLKKSGREVDKIEKTIQKTMENIDNGVKSFAIYGEPQSGKTEMMIALTAKLLDNDNKVIIILLNDIVQLLNQNLNRFKSSGIVPLALDIEEIVQEKLDTEEDTFVIFCKKNQVNLKKLITKSKKIDNKIIIDDEADYATPNSKINKKEISAINKLTKDLIGASSVYIGVTATPARLDLNRTHGNISEKWVDFCPHSRYVGADIFFPPKEESNLKYKLNQLPDTGTEPKYLRIAIFNFMITSTYLNMYEPNIEGDGNWSMLIHTTGKKEGHEKDAKEVRKIFNQLRKEEKSSGDKNFNEIYSLAKDRYNADKALDITKKIFYIFRKHDIIIMNSDNPKAYEQNIRATKPVTPFTIIIGGNIVSRGVTFNSLLSMFFTRDVKHKLGQDTYIQRARMFGSRKEYIQYFELSIPRKLFLNWADCFFYHRLSLKSREATGKSPIWIEGGRIQTTQRNSIDEKRIILNKGELDFEKTLNVEPIANVLKDKTIGNLSKLERISQLEPTFLPKYLLDFIKNETPVNLEELIHIFEIRDIEAYDKKKIRPVDYENIWRSGGLISSTEMKKSSGATHFFLIEKNKNNQARLFYKHRTLKLRFLSQRT